MKKPAISSPAAGDSSVASVVSTPVSVPVSTSPPQVFLPVAEAADAADEDGPAQLKQVKTKVTERIKKTAGKPDNIIWDVRVGSAQIGRAHV